MRPTQNSFLFQTNQHVTRARYAKKTINDLPLTINAGGTFIIGATSDHEITTQGSTLLQFYRFELRSPDLDKAGLALEVVCSSTTTLNDSILGEMTIDQLQAVINPDLTVCK